MVYFWMDLVNLEKKIVSTEQSDGIVHVQSITYYWLISVLSFQSFRVTYLLILNMYGWLLFGSKLVSFWRFSPAQSVLLQEE